MQDPIEVGCTHEDDKLVVVFMVDRDQFTDQPGLGMNMKMSVRDARLLALDILAAVEDVEQLIDG